MATLTSLTQGGLTWEPRFIKAINQETCLGCGRCYKVCGRNVLGLKPMNEFGEFVDEDEDDDDDIERQVMTIVDLEKCIGCEACARICPKKCHSHEPASV